MIVATAGHVDHGKTTLVQAITGAGLDRRPEEKRRGMTIDVGFTYLAADSALDGDPEPIGFVDVPGHQDFVRNMLCGVTGADFALLVIAADDGPRAQTLEHLAILDLLGLARGAVVLTKIDRVAPARLAQVRSQVQALRVGTTLAAAPVFEVCAATGQGIAALRAHLQAAAAADGRRSTAGNFRLAIDRSFTLPGAGLIVTGIAVSGSIEAGAAVHLLGSGKSARARSIHAQNRSSEQGRAGQRCAINLAGTTLSADAVARGEWLVAGDVAAPAHKIDARLRVAPAEGKALAHWSPVHIHLAASHVTGRIAVLEGGAIEPGRSGLVQLVLDRPLAALHGDRFIVRDHSAQRTIAGGRVIDLFPPARGRSRPTRLAELAAAEIEAAPVALQALLAQARDGVSLHRFGLNRGLTPAQAQVLHATVAMAQIPTSSGPRAFSPAVWSELRAAALKELAAWHESAPGDAGPAADRLLKKWDCRLPRETVLAVVSALAREGAIVKSGLGVCLPSHRPHLDPADEKRWNAIEPLLREGGRRPPSVPLISYATGDGIKVLEATLGRAARCGKVIRVSPSRFFLSAPLLQLAETVQALAQRDGHATVVSLRDASGIGRRIAVEVMDFFDRVKYTRRIADTHLVACDPRDIFPADGDRAHETGRASDPGGPLGLQIRWEASDVSGGFDSHALPPPTIESRH